MGKKKRTGECGYCGKMGPLTIEHVIPQCLFMKPLPPDIVKIPVCYECNSEKAKDDDYLRDFLVTDIYNSEHPIAKQIFLSKTLSASRQNKSKLSKDAVSKGQNQPLYTPGGVYLTEAFAVPLDGERVNAIFIRIIKGLFYRKFEKRIPDNYVFQVKTYSPLEFREIAPQLAKTITFTLNRCGDVLDSLMTRAQEDEFCTAWWLCFYGGRWIEIYTMPPDTPAA